MGLWRELPDNERLQGGELRIGADKGNPIVLLKQSMAMTSKGVDAMRFLPSALNVNAMKFKHANGGSNYDSLKA